MPRTATLLLGLTREHDSFFVQTEDLHRALQEQRFRGYENKSVSPLKALRAYGSKLFKMGDMTSFARGAR